MTPRFRFASLIPLAKRHFRSSDSRELMRMHRSLTTVSVVIPVRNAAEDLRECLTSVKASTDVEFEIIVVDDASTDLSRAVVAEYGCRLIAVRDRLGAANCRNLGARLSRSELIVFCDADQTLDTGVLAAYAEALQRDAGVDAVVGSLAARTPAPGFFSQFKNFQHHYTHQTARSEGATLDSGRMAIRRDVFLDLGGFEPAFAGASIEDIALGYRMVRLGHRIRFVPDIQLVHLKGYTLAQMVRSDIFHRAIPWTGLMLRERMFRNDLNTRSGNVASVALAGGAAVAALAAAFGWPLAGATALAGAFAMVAGIWWLNRDFLAAMRREFGLGFALRGAAFLPLMYGYQGVGLLAGIVTYLAGGSVAARREAPVPHYELREPAPPTR